MKGGIEQIGVCLYQMFDHYELNRLVIQRSFIITCGTNVGQSLIFWCNES